LRAAQAVDHRLVNRRGPYIAAIAAANRNARICWALLSKG